MRRCEHVVDMFPQTDDFWICFRKQRKRSKSVDMFPYTDDINLIATRQLEMAKAADAIIESTEVPKSVKNASDERMKTIIKFCSTPRSRDEIMSHIGLVNREYFRKNILNPLLEAGILERTDKDNPKSKNQKYIVKH